MEDINLGKKVQDFRNKSGMSLRELAKRAGLTASMLSQIERDLVNPSIGPGMCPCSSFLRMMNPRCR